MLFRSGGTAIASAMSPDRVTRHWAICSGSGAGIDTIAEAVALGVDTLIVGEGPQRWRLERFARQVKMDDRVHFLGERDDVPQVLARCDCFWLASGYEGQSNALMEAMRAGVPVVVSSDAHRVEELAFVRYGVDQARRGWCAASC